MTQSSTTLLDQAEAFLETLRRSSEMAQTLLTRTREMALRIRSLEDDLGSAKERIVFLETETHSLRSGLATEADQDGERLQQELEQLAEEQNCMAHMFVTSDRLLRVAGQEEALQAAEEVLHNLIGALNYGIWLRQSPADKPVLVAPRDPRQRRGVERHIELVRRGLDSDRPIPGESAPPNGAPICFPLQLEGRTVGVLLIADLVPQVPELGRLQRDLLALISERLATSICLGALQAQLKDPFASWPTLAGGLKLVADAS